MSRRTPAIPQVTINTGAKAWTILVYMAGDNNLDPEGVQDLKEMKKVGSTNQINVVAQFDRQQGHVARRYYLRKGGLATSDVVASLGAVNTDDLATSVAALAKAMKASLKDPAARQRILMVRSQVQSYEVPENIDLVDLCTLLAKSGADTATTAACNAVVKAVKGNYVIAEGDKGVDMKNSNGLAIYFPTRSVSPLYPGLDFSKATGWDGFVTAFIKTMRSR